jgi:hypothetical protein
MPDLLAVLRGLLPGPWRPSSRASVPLTDVPDDGTLTPSGGGPLRAVLRLPPEGLDADRASTAALQRLAAAINAGAGRATLLAWGKPHSLAGQLQDRQERVRRLPPGSGRHELAASQVRHLRTMAEGAPATPERPARHPARRHGFNLVVEGRTRAELDRLCDDLCPLYGAVRVPGREAAAIAADVWRGLRLPPRRLQLWQDADDAPDVELFISPKGARVRRVDPDTGRELEVLPPWRP